MWYWNKYTNIYKYLYEMQIYDYGQPNVPQAGYECFTDKL
jgi:hypothetical protein